MLRTGVAIVAAALMALALWMLTAQTRGLTIARMVVGPTPISVYTAGTEPAPVVVIAHGFAGSRQLMEPFATTLARSGYVAVTYDSLGHGRNPAPLTGDVTSEAGATAALVAELGRVAEAARALPQSDGRLAVLGHSMASDIVVRHALADPGTAATVAVSMFSPVVTAEEPRNLLVITGAWEPGLTDEALRVTTLFAGEEAGPGVTYGDPATGTARRAVLSPNVEHIGVLFSAASLAEARDWLNATFGRDTLGAPDRRGPWLALWFAGAVALAWGAAPLLPRVAPAHAASPGAPPLPWRRFAVAGLVPALLTPPIAWLVPAGLIPVPVADYLAVHFPIYGLITAATLLWLRRFPGPADPLRLLAATAAITAFALLMVFLPIERFFTAFLPTPGRLPLLLALFAGLLVFFVADETLTRTPGVPRFAYAFTKLCFLLSLALAIALDLPRLFFLIIILPVIVLFFVLFGLVSRWSEAQTGHPLPAALAKALLFAWAIAVTFPVLGS